MIRVRAFQIYERGGRVPDRDAENWFQAEQEIISFLIDEEQRRADDVRRSGNTTATIPESEISAIGSSGGEAAMTAEERAESQSSLGAWSATEPAGVERAPSIGETTANKPATRAASKTATSRKSKADSSDKDAAPKKTTRSAGAKKTGEPSAKKRGSTKKAKAEEGA
jgi:hypothetical protein